VLHRKAASPSLVLKGDGSQHPNVLAGTLEQVIGIEADIIMSDKEFLLGFQSHNSNLIFGIPDRDGTQAAQTSSAMLPITFQEVGNER
jgi:hypothetical protein